MTARLNCPLCEWFHDDPGPNPLSTDPMALASVFGPGVFAAHAMADHQRKIEDILAAHFKTHTMVEWLRRVTALRAEVDRLKHAMSPENVQGLPNWQELYNAAALERHELRSEAEALRASVKEWGCEECNYVYPGPPQQGFKCITCPRCGGSTMPLSLMKERAAERKGAALRKALNDIHGHLYAANVQRAASDDRIIAEHIASALACSSAALSAEKLRFTDGRGNDLTHLVG